MRARASVLRHALPSEASGGERRALNKLQLPATPLLRKAVLPRSIHTRPERRAQCDIVTHPPTPTVMVAYRGPSLARAGAAGIAEVWSLHRTRRAVRAGKRSLAQATISSVQLRYEQGSCVSAMGCHSLFPQSMPPVGGPRLHLTSNNFHATAMPSP